MALARTVQAVDFKIWRREIAFGGTDIDLRFRTGEPVALLVNAHISLD